MKQNIGQAIYAALTAHSICELTVSFSGGGDSGDIYDVAFYRLDSDGNKTPVKSDSFINEEISFVAKRVHNTYANGISSSETVFSDCEMALGAAIEKMVLDKVSETGVDWYNDDGGSGFFTLDLTKNEVTLSIDVNYTESRNEHLQECSTDEWFNGGDKVFASAEELNELNAAVAL